MAGQYRFKDINGNIVAQISASSAGAISFSGSAVDFSNASTITLGEVQLAGTASNALLLDGFDSTAFVFTSSFNTISQSISSQLTTLQTTSGSNIGRLNNLESKSSSVDISISNINSVTSSVLSRTSNLESKSSSVDISISNINSVTASNIARLSNLETKSSSVDISITNINSVTASNLARLTNLETKSASVDISVSSINTFTSSNGNTSLNTFTASNDITSLNSKTGSYATTGSNTFFGTQTYSGSVYIANDLVVQGSSSIQYISASSVSIGTNIVQLNTANPSVRYAGLTITDSGSIGGSGSFLYDSVQDEFIFVHRGNGTNITSSHFVLGPETIDDLGNEIYLTNNRLPKGTGKEHLVDSCITDNGSSICFNTPTGSFSGKLGVGASNPKWLLEVCANNGCTGAGQYPGISINNGCTTGDSGLYFYNGLTQMGGMETSNSTGNILINSQAALSLQTANTNRISIANTGAVTISCQLYLDGCNRDTVFVKSNNNTFSRLFYAGQNSIVFHNGGTTACGGNWGLNNYEDTAALFRVFNNGTTNFYGRVCMCNLQILSIGSCCQGSIRLGGENGTGNSRLFFESNGNNSYIDNYGDSEYKKLSIEASCLILNGVSGGRVGIGTGTPSSTLHILGLNDNQVKIDVAAGCSYSSLNFARNGTNVGAIAYAHNANEFQVPYTNCSCGYIAMYTGAGKVVTIDKNGFANFTCNIFAPGTPIQVVTGNATVSSGAQGTGVGMGTANGGGTTPVYNSGIQIAATSFTPKSATSKILIMTNNVAMWERSNVSDHFYLWAANTTDGTMLVKSGMYLINFGPGSSNGGIISLNGSFSSWGVSAKTISFRIGTTGSDGAYYEWNPYYGAGGFNADTVGNFTWTIMEIAQ